MGENGLGAIGATEHETIPGRWGAPIDANVRRAIRNLSQFSLVADSPGSVVVSQSALLAELSVDHEGRGSVEDALARIGAEVLAVEQFPPREERSGSQVALVERLCYVIPRSFLSCE